ncbi:hypothetical protein MRX96_058702 [Rhipicephalus microplus]
MCHTRSPAVDLGGSVVELSKSEAWSSRPEHTERGTGCNGACILAVGGERCVVVVSAGRKRAVQTRCQDGASCLLGRVKTGAWPGTAETCQGASQRSDVGAQYSTPDVDRHSAPKGGLNNTGQGRHLRQRQTSARDNCSHFPGTSLGNRSGGQVEKCPA